MSAATSRTVVIIQARMGSSRLPGKVLLPVGGATMLGQVVRRCQQARRVDAVVVATTTDASDDPLVAACQALAVPCVRGSAEDVLARFVLAADASRADLVVRVTADCPLMEPAEIDRLVDRWHREADAGRRLDWVSNQLGERRRIPRGLDVEVVPASSLRRAAAAARDPAEREHVTPWFYRDPARSALLVVDPPGPDRSDLRLTVDTAADLALIRALVARLGDDCDLDAVAALLAAEPALRALNADVAQKSVVDEQTLRRQRWHGRVVIGRADASPGIGVGHVGRVGALLEAIVAHGGQGILVGGGVVGALRARLERAGVAVHDVDDPAAADLAWIERARQLGAAAAVVDSYRVDATTVAAMQAVAPVVAIDDHGEALRGADVVLYQGPAERAAVLFAGAPGRVLAGPAYALLRGEVLQARQRTVSVAAASGQGAADPGGAWHVVITMGGADFGGWTAPLTAALRAAWPGETGRIAVVLGPAAPAAEAAALAARWQHDAVVRVWRDPPQPAVHMAAAALAISASGSTAWELAAVGVPAVLVVVAANQRGVASAIADAGAATVVDAAAIVRGGAAADGVIAAVVAAALAITADAGRADAMRRAGLALVDGRGPARILDAVADVLQARGPQELR